MINIDKDTAIAIHGSILDFKPLTEMATARMDDLHKAIINTSELSEIFRMQGELKVWRNIEELEESVNKNRNKEK